jgi:hypothetical protein
MSFYALSGLAAQACPGRQALQVETARPAGTGEGAATFPAGTPPDGAQK